ncbi:MAG TPA: cupin domain-containing protein [Thermoanaerobaculia bacterium]|jgi:mannose-6-phosphate isomerase-like protein (cupin superfamily)|nr:cupin domain-containing protein [Thermoanaerobaculia bacterium]
MDLFRLGLRSVLGITLPGAMLALISGYVFLSVLFLLNQPVPDFLWSKDQQLLVFSVLFLVSYNVGGLLRLNSADTVDKKSAKKLRQNPKLSKQQKADLDGVATTLEAGEIPGELPPLAIQWIWATEPFPYPRWQFLKFERYHPREVGKFFEEYRECMGLGSQSEKRVGRGKEFFNYCKMVVLHSSRSPGDALIEEVHYAEATVRFYAGTYTGLRPSLLLLVTLLVGQIIFLAVPGLRGQYGLSTMKVINAFVTMALIAASAQTMRIILKRFRTLRLKEVDTVYDAFYLVHRHADSCPECSTARPLRSAAYAERERLLRKIFDRTTSEPVGLDALLAAMKKQSGEAGKEHLSALYFAGERPDHPFFLRSETVAAGLSVLPEDREKAGQSKRHPHQEEVIVVVDGTLRLIVEDGGTTVEEDLRQGDVRVIKKGQCHRIEPVAKRDSAFLFVKTHPAREPRSEKCRFPEV